MKHMKELIFLKKLKIKVKKKEKDIKTEKSSKKEKKKKKGRVKNAVLITLFSLGIVVASAILAFALYIIITSPDFVAEELYTKEPTVLYDVNGDEIARIGNENVELVTYSDLPQVLVDALIATEDSRFFQHNGFDAARFIRASLGQLAGQDAGGASTLSMQVIKNTYTSSVSEGIAGIIRKFTDIYMAVFKLEASYTKEEIIEFYLNSQWLGGGSTNYASINGVEQGSQYYFGKSVSDLTLAEASLLVGMFNNPSLYNPYNNPEGASNRRSTVLSLMVRHGYITEEEKEFAESVPVQSLLVDRSNDENASMYQAFIDYTLLKVEEETGDNPYTTPMEIYTTLDPDIQEVLNMLENEEIYTFANDTVQFGMAVTSTVDGSVLALSGGRNYVAQGTNRAVGTEYRGIKNQLGSTAKIIFDYGPYIEYLNGSTGSLFLDEQWSYTTGGSVVNSDRTYWGEITMRRALVNSRNVPAIQAMQQVINEVGSDVIAEFASSLGIDYGEALYESAGLGGAGGSNPLAMSAAYAAFGRGGIYIEPYTFTKIIYTETEEEYNHVIVQERVMSEETAYMITDILVDAGASGVGGNFTISGTDIAAKGGTSTIDSESASALGIPSSATPNHWNITYSPDYSIALWFGYDDLREGYLTSGTGYNPRRQIMAAVAKLIYKTGSKFEQPSGVVSATIELGTYPLQLASEYTPSSLKSTELFKAGYEPTEVSTRFSKLDAPTNGSYTFDGSTIRITWDAIATPDAINPDYLEEYFNGYFSNYYSQYAEQYYQARISYNNSNIGTIGYQVYLQDASGNLISLGYTTNNYYTYSASAGGEYTFVIKSAYSIFKDNMSDGLTITASANIDSNIGDIVSPTDPDDEDDNPDNDDGNTTIPPTDTGLE